MTSSVGDFHIVPGATVARIVDRILPEIVNVVRDAYRAHAQGRTVNPASGFLRFPSSPDARIIALPASLEFGDPVAGIKWIASFPGNVAHNQQRASAVLLLNDRATGYPLACLEAGRISAARTAASAVLGGEAIVGGRRAGRVLIVGAGVIAREVVTFLAATGWEIGSIAVADTDDGSAAHLARYASSVGFAAAPVSAPVAEVAAGCDLIVFATTAAEPWYDQPFRAGQTVLGLSLRDIAVDTVLAASNVVDDVDHCLTAQTSLHRAEQRTGGRAFVTGTLAQLLDGEIVVDPDRPTIFSPFGMGVLDLAVGAVVYREAIAEPDVVTVHDFLGDTSRWATGDPVASGARS